MSSPTTAPELSPPRKRTRGDRRNGSQSTPASNDGGEDEGLEDKLAAASPNTTTPPTTATPTMQQRKRQRRLPKSAHRAFLRKNGELYDERAVHAALRGSDGRARMRAEILRQYPSLGKMGRNASEVAQRDAENARDDEDGGDGDVGGGGNDEGEAGGVGERACVCGPPLPENDPLPVLPLFADPSPELGALYDDVESALAVQERTRTAAAKARRVLREAAAAEARADAALDSAKARVRSAELAEPCRWNDMLGRLRAFRAERGHVLVPNSRALRAEDDPDLYELARFDLSLRDMYRGGTLQRHPHRVEACEALGYDWKRRAYNFAGDQLEDLRRFKLKHGHCNVKESDDKALYDWVSRARYRHKKRATGKTKEREWGRSAKATQAYDHQIAALKELLGGEEELEDFMRPRIRGRGRLRVEAMQLHRKKAKHCVHPDPDMREWAKGIRERYRRKMEGHVAKYSLERCSDNLVEAMDHMGFCWTERCECAGAPEDQDPTHEEEEKGAAGEEGDAENDSHGEENGEAERKKGAAEGGPNANAPPDDDGIFGFELEPESPYKMRRTRSRSKVAARSGRNGNGWDRGINALVAFKDSNGHCRVRFKDDRKLREWLDEAKRLCVDFRREQERMERRSGNDGDDGAETDSPHAETEERDGSEERKGKKEKVRVTVANDGALRMRVGDKVMTDERAKQFEAVIGKWSPYERGGEDWNFRTMFGRWKDWKDREAHCVHPQATVKAWVAKCKARYRAQLLREGGSEKNGYGEGQQQQSDENDGHKQSENSQSDEKEGVKHPNTNGRGASLETSQTEKDDLKPWQIDMLNDAGLCWMRGCYCDDPQQKAAKMEDWWLAERPIRHFGKHFDEGLAMLREHKNKVGHCIHPETWACAFFRRLKGRRRALIEKREREGQDAGEEGGGKSQEDDRGAYGGKGVGGEGEADAAGGAKRRTKKPKPKRKPSKERPLDDEQMAKLAGLDLCWGHGCQCPGGPKKSEDGKPRTRPPRKSKIRPAAPAEAARYRIEDAHPPTTEAPQSPANALAQMVREDADANAGAPPPPVVADPALPPDAFAATFDRMLGLFLAHRSLNGGRCRSDTVAVQGWYDDILAQCAARVPPGGVKPPPLARRHVSELLRSGICLKRDVPCRCAEKARFDRARARRAAALETMVGAAFEYEQSESASAAVSVPKAVPRKDAAGGEILTTSRPTRGAREEATLGAPSRADGTGLAPAPDTAVSTPVSKIVAELNSLELGFLSAKVVDEVRRRKSWSSSSSDGGSSDNGSSNGDDGDSLSSEVSVVDLGAEREGDDDEASKEGKVNDEAPKEGNDGSETSKEVKVKCSNKAPKEGKDGNKAPKEAKDNGKAPKERKEASEEGQDGDVAPKEEKDRAVGENEPSVAKGDGRKREERKVEASVVSGGHTKERSATNGNDAVSVGEASVDMVV